jgi:alkanesulfonate monooxygenase SsuD/methylene tetrahydromethanopterin reductase-like flavin-dependent oxidoreductase (luciferase family)
MHGSDAGKKEGGMKFGLFYEIPCAPNQSPAQRYEETLAQIELADELGFETAWLAELHFHRPLSIMSAPLLVAAALARRTRRIRLGIAVNVLPLHHPVRCAEETATLDVLSGGRMEFGAGRGALAMHFEGFNIPQDEAGERFLESLEVIKKAWTEENFSYQGKFFTIGEVSVVPKPVQQPHPPIRVASNSPETFQRMGQLGYPIFATPVIVPMEGIRQGIATYREGLIQHGHKLDGDGHELSFMLPVYVAPRAAAGRSVPEASIMHYYRVLADLEQHPSTQRAIAANPHVKEFLARFAQMTYDQVDNTIAAYGDPKRCLERLQALKEEFHMGEVVCWFNTGGLIAHPQVMDAMRLFADKVMPYVG